MAKRSRRFMDLGLIQDFAVKKLETEQRLSRVFIAFINNPMARYVVVGGDVTPCKFGNNNFSCVIAGRSLADLAYGQDLFREISSHVAATFSEEDLHSTVILDFFRTALRWEMEDMRVPQGYALEVMIADKMGHLIRIDFSGEIEIDDLGDDKDIILSGAYDENFKKRLLVDLKKAPKKINEEALEIFGKYLEKKYKLKNVCFIA